MRQSKHYYLLEHIQITKWQKKKKVDVERYRPHRTSLRPAPTTLGQYHIFLLRRVCHVLSLHLQRHTFKANVYSASPRVCLISDGFEER
jgi:hypothetical protein